MDTYSIFDIIGPVMIGPSSSHTAGATKIGNMATRIFNKPIIMVEFHLHGSFYKTYKGHGTDKALLAGIMGFKADDDRIRDSYIEANKRNINYKFISKDLGEVHPNTVKIIMYDNNNNICEVIGSSIGGGKISITNIDDTEVELDGEYSTLITKHVDKPGVIAKICTILSVHNINIAFMRVFRYSKGDYARLIVQVDDVIDENVILAIKQINEVTESKFIKCF